MSENDIRERLESLVDRWLRATPTEKAMLLHEKIRLEDLLDEARAGGRAN